MPEIAENDLLASHRFSLESNSLGFEATTVDILPKTLQS